MSVLKELVCAVKDVGRCVLKELVCAVKGGEDECVEGFCVKIVCSTQNGQHVPWP